MARDGKDNQDENITNTSPGTNLSRRAFLGASGTIAVGLQTSDVIAQSDAPFFERRPNGAARVTWSGRIWEVDPCWFHSSASTIVVDSTSKLRIRGRVAGSNLTTNFTIRIKQVSNEWKFLWLINGREHAITVNDWFLGKELSGITLSRTTNFPTGALDVGEALAGSLRWPMQFDLGPTSGSDFNYRLSSTNSGQASRLSFMPYDNVGNAGGYSSPILTTDFADLVPASAVPKMRLELTRVALADPDAGWRVGTVGDGSVLRFLPELPRIVIEVLFRLDLSTPTFAHGWRLSAAAKHSRLIVGDESKPRSLLLGGGTELIEIYGFGNLIYAFVAGLSDEPRMVQGLRYAATVRGRGRAKVLKGFRGAANITLPITLYTLHARGEDDARYDVDFRRWKRGDPYLDRSAILTSNPWFNESVDASDGVDGVLTIGSRPPTSPAPNHLHLGSESGAIIFLGQPGASGIAEETPILRARRHLDGLDIGFLFHDYRLEVRNDGSRLRPGPTGQRGIWFHPQHLQEEAFTGPEAKDAATGFSRFLSILRGAVRAFAAEADELKPRLLGTEATYAEPGVLTKLARSRAAAPSRVIFQSSGAATTIRLSVDALTDWEGLRLNVSERMSDAQNSLDDQLDILGIKHDTSREEARRLVNAQFIPPKPSETALELVAGLVFSPDGAARLRVAGRPKAGDAGLWSAQLDLSPLDAALEGSSQVRAIWAAGLKSENLITKDKPDKPLASDAPFATSINGRQKAEIVMMSSGLGIAAVRALSKTGQDVPASLVRRPKEQFDYLDNEPRPKKGDDSGFLYHQEGVISPAPFSRFEARLSPYGADLDLEWKGEPAGPWPNWKKETDEAFFNKAFSVEEYVHHASLGSDILVKILEKGFMFPYGFRVILLQVSQREPRAVAEMGAMAPVIQRFFIVPKPVIKSLPGIYQPFNGLEIPVRHAQLNFKRSPELDPAMTPPPELATFATIVGRAFWPKFKGLQKEIAFDFEADDTGTRRSVPMMFLDNAAVHDPETVRAVIHYYNNLKDEALRLRSENHYGGRTIYAAPKEAGDTSFETDHIVLMARSRIVETDATIIAGAAPKSDPDLVQFQMDAFMEGADEPPFYPVMHEASIKIPPLDRLLGSPQGLKKVGYNGNYLRNGFDPKTNPSELYLNFTDEGGLMQLSGRGEISGGLSQTPTPLAGISRANTIVGAKSRPKSLEKQSSGSDAAAQRASAMPPVGADERTPFDLSAAEKNSFEPSNFFKLPKLLGCIDIGQAVLPALMASQPKLKEVYDYTLGQADEGEEAIVAAFAEVAGEAAGAVFKAMKDAEERLCKFLSEETHTPVQPSDDYKNLERFYPELTKGLVGLAKELDNLKSATKLSDILNKANSTMEAWRRLRGAVDAVIANPAPEPVRDIIAALRTALDGAENLIRSALKDQVAAVLDAFVKNLLYPLRDAILDEVFDGTGKLVNQWLYEAFFGPIKVAVNTAITRQLLSDEIDALIARQMPKEATDEPTYTVDLANAPLAYALTLPVLELVGAVWRLRKESETAEAKLLAQLAEAAISVLRVALDAVATVQSLVDTVGAAVDRACTMPDGPLSKMFALATEGLPETRNFKSVLVDLDREWTELLLPNLGSSPQAGAVRQAAAGLRVPMMRLAEQVDPLDMLRAAFPQDDSGKLNWCKSIGRIPSAIAEIHRRRRIATVAITDCAAQSRIVLQALMALSEAERRDAVNALAAMRKAFATLCFEFTIAFLADTAQESLSALTTRLQLLGAPVIARLGEVKTKVFDAAMALKTELAAAEISDETLVVVAHHAVDLGKLEQTLFALATDYTAVSDRLLVHIKGVVASVATEVAAPLIAVHQFVYDGAGVGIKLVEDAPDIVALLTGPLYDRLKIAQASVLKDLNNLKDVAKDPIKAVGLVNRWKTEEPGLAIASRTLAEMFDAIARGQIGALFDLAGARRAVEEAVRRLIPSKVKLAYEWEADLTPFPPGNPIFLPRVDEELGDPEKLETKDLVIKTAVEVDLLNPKDRQVSVKGTLNPFTLHLLGSNDFVRIYFTDTVFSSDGRGSPNFKTKVSKVKLGTGLAFIQKIQDSMMGGSGFTVKPSFAPPGVEIGYSIGEPVIEMGIVTFLNVALGVSVLLPFDDSPAKFSFAFASSERPFGIIVKPYYFGGGFVIMKATAVAAEFNIQMEFGAAAEIKFGPLKGWGLVSTGINLRTDEGQLALKGFVHALGEGQLGCFGMSVNIEVAVQQKGETMTGTSTYTYSFSVGFASVDFEFEASYAIAGGASASKASHDDLQYKATFAEKPPYELGYQDKTAAWLAYRDHFVGAWS
ncbi:hypothetical protein G6L94_21915 [Agrobacterium rhizogenes]|nr:hypothetical protein [Rhizobium rhizogenes]NTI96355.1 hypothetical protein [Rhizobium rhizogenes]NTJ61081.1 hypothetical protein [Rhizobium rhizogenes]OCJ23842.1 hypothetical protein A6U89_31775 [Agrobacterium sp. B133/95]